MIPEARFSAVTEYGVLDYVSPTYTQLTGMVLAFARGWEIEKHLPVDKSVLAVDVGACVGSWGVNIARTHPNVKVICIEPVMRNYACLSYNARGCENIRLIHAAADEKPGRISIGMPDGNGYQNVFKRFQVKNNCGLMTAYGKHDMEEVQAYTLDEMVSDAVGVLKIDVEGMESRVIAGAQRIMTLDRPFLQIEMRERNQQRAGSSVEALWNLIASYDYQEFAVDNADSLFAPRERITVK